ncbi:MAG TPA: hypothetical protein VJ302_30585 [Blastocatellia bacterium]|nr:hypothetical protein [Blastocatellia bacterium]
MLPGRYTRSRSVSAKGGFMATILVLALLTGAVPLNLLNSDELCTMACCAMRGPHSAASHCSDTVCHLDPGASKKKEVVKPEPAAEACHAEPPAAKPAPPAAVAESSVPRRRARPHAHDHHQGHQDLGASGPSRSGSAHPGVRPLESTAVGAMAVIAAACPRSCGALTAYSFNQHRQSEPAASMAPAAPNSLLYLTPFGSVFLSSRLQRQFPPRAPPSNLS